ncbi:MULTISPECIES: TetR/AcrR family transcriptional regulator [Sphingobacterium]|jgi:TetR/AcrR family transcriptional repressor of mexJK operon|uniref:TetR/AcrR family transcriptional regulator n=1 Tax=Sphingobacterium kitahiroshimense TaxID=470446 RepID=A0ABV0C0L9_9SPHI|nr:MULTISPECIES: TetR/AcrR family transcriptional regulator [unclassified Sphingobacterium]KKX47905.1 transcriptional regulator [Sphingobacterium sp. IITKGP-BTPF85]MBB2952412.1 TetR/AcrR family transcriptional repressor of mexJK operon [Sphingobacterium sp. JUb56]MCS3557349.1 TetR/AcrR family transcriptional repressor of mexJK operon [Sphingobacterium sp. JUb21]NJI76475.1 TetR/AcrR family transcriptional regulator [Sphingobacterium sp. B16(2022)]QQD14337.1 TetR/AcrR family transcriptional regu
MANADLKRTRILEAATRRFAHFGMAKTTMSEIATDLNFSKALLYYYFPDKNSLYSAVFEYVIDKMVQDIREKINTCDDFEEIMMYTIDKRVELINQYYNLFEYTINMVKELPEELERVFKESYVREVDLFAEILEIGVETDKIEVEDVEETARILLYSLFGMRMGILKDMKNMLFPTKDEFDVILSLQKKMMQIFLRGLRK